jgi:ABC-type molybdate transport system substrate-binding protein
LTHRLSASGHYFEIPRNLYPPIQQGAVIVSRSVHRAEARRFLEYLLSGPGQDQLAHAGLTPVRR